MTSPKLNPQPILATLACHNVRYVLVGALAAVAHGARLETDDLDLCPATDPDNLARVATVLRDLDAWLIREPARGSSAVDLADPPSLRLDNPGEHHLFSTPHGQLDVFIARTLWTRRLGQGCDLR